MKEVLSMLMSTIDPTEYKSEDDYYKELTDICLSQFGEIPSNLSEFAKEEWKNAHDD